MAQAQVMGYAHGADSACCEACAVAREMGGGPLSCCGTHATTFVGGLGCSGCQTCEAMQPGGVGGAYCCDGCAREAARREPAAAYPSPHRYRQGKGLPELSRLVVRMREAIGGGHRADAYVHERTGYVHGRYVHKAIGHEGDHVPHGKRHDPHDHQRRRGEQDTDDEGSSTFDLASFSSMSDFPHWKKRRGPRAGPARGPAADRGRRRPKARGLNRPSPSPSRSSSPSSSSLSSSSPSPSSTSASSSPPAAKPCERHSPSSSSATGTTTTDTTSTDCAKGCCGGSCGSCSSCSSCSSCGSCPPCGSPCRAKRWNPSTLSSCRMSNTMSPCSGVDGAGACKRGKRAQVKRGRRRSHGSDKSCESDASTDLEELGRKAQRLLEAAAGGGRRRGYRKHSL